MPPRAARPVAALAALALTASLSAGCDVLGTMLPTLAFCGSGAAPADLARLGEGPALFIDAIRQVALEVGQQTDAVGRGLGDGLSVSRQALEALGPYQYQGNGSYSRSVADDRAFRLRFYYGTGVTGKTPGSPLEADMARLDSYMPDMLNPFGPQGPLFPLVTATGLTSGKLQFRDEALRFDLGSLVKTTLRGYDLQLALGTSPTTAGELLRQIQDRKLAFSLADTRMASASKGFELTIKRFGLTYGLDGQASLGGDYLFEVRNGTLRYFGAVKTAGGQPVASLRCTEAEDTEFATMTFTNGQANFSMRGDRFPIALPGLAQPRSVL